MRLFNIFKPKDHRTYVIEKTADIEHQILYLKNEPTLSASRPLGSTELTSPKDLILFHENRIKVLQKIANNNKMENIELLNFYHNKLCSNCRQLFLRFRTSAVPCETDYQNYCYADLIQQAIDNGY